MVEQKTENLLVSGSSPLLGDVFIIKYVTVLGGVGGFIGLILIYLIFFMFSGILLFPICLFAYLLLFSELKPKSLLISGVIGYTFTLLSVIYLLYTTCFINFSGKFVYSYQFFSWSTLANVDVGLNVWLDYVSVIMSFTVILIAFMVNIFSVYYMANDPFIVRFFSYLSLFTFCMLLLVTANDLLQFFIGWELVGMCSYLLINFWYTRKQANMAAAKAVLVNRVGDFFFLYGMSLIFLKFGTLNLYDLSWIFITNSHDFVNFDKICLFMFIAIMSKSAQIGLHMWLPDAMEGPTPVSALIHAATMVTAGIYLLLRLSTLFLICEDILKFVTVIGSTTALFGATTGSAQTDIKKIIAFSTCSQLGYMVTACGLGQFNLAFFHLVTHAFFKSLLFLSAGVIIHTLGGEQDIRKMGSLKNILPITYTAITIASLALSGMPYLSGYYSKELIITAAFTSNTFVGFLSGVVLVISAVFTSGYSAKLIYYVFIAKSKDDIFFTSNLHQEDSEQFKYFQIIPLYVLSIMSIFTGYFFKDMIAGIGSNTTLSFFEEFNVTNSASLWLEFVPFYLKFLLNFASFSGFLFYFLIHKDYLDINMYFKKLPSIQLFNSFFFNRWYLDTLIAYFANYISLFFWENSNIGIMQIKVIDFLTVSVSTSFVNSMSQASTNLFVHSAYNYVRLTVFSMLITIFVTNLAIDLVEFSF